jgi:hypothetical protein
VIGHFKSERSLGNAIYFAEEIPACIVEKGFAVRKEELKIAYLGRINGGVIDLGETSGIERVPHATGGGIRGANRDFCAVRPAGFDSRPTGAACQFGDFDVCFRSTPVDLAVAPATGRCPFNSLVCIL